MDYTDIEKKLASIHYHQTLILEMLNDSNFSFYRIIIKNNIDQDEVNCFLQLCDKLSIELEEQKAEGFVYFHPLYNEFSERLHCKLNVEEVIHACIKQKIYPDLMQELKKYLT